MIYIDFTLFSFQYCMLFAELLLRLVLASPSECEYDHQKSGIKSRTQVW